MEIFSTTDFFIRVSITIKNDFQSFPVTFRVLEVSEPFQLSLRSLTEGSGLRYVPSAVTNPEGDSGVTTA